MNVVEKTKKFLGKLTKKKVIVLAIAVLVVVAVVAMGGKKPVVAPVSTMPLQKTTIEQVISLKAPLEGRESVEVVSNLHYEVMQIPVKEGDKVKKGQVLAILNNETLTDQVQKAQDNLKLDTYQYEAGMTAKQNEYDKAAEDYQDAKRKFDRIQVLYNEGAESLQALETEKNTLNSARRRVEAFETSNGRVVDDAAAKKVEMSRKQLESQQKVLDDARIKSPIDGTVTRINVKVGRFADDTEGKKPMFVIENIEQLQMKVAVSEFDIGKVQVGQAVKVTADVLDGESVDGVVSRISPTGEAKAQGSNERIVPIQIDVIGTNSKLVAGITAKATIMIAFKENVFAVPINAVLTNPDGTTCVYKVNAQSTIEILPVTLGLEGDLLVEVSGEKLQEGDNLLQAPSMEYTQGMAVVVIEQPVMPAE